MYALEMFVQALPFYQRNWLAPAKGICVLYICIYIYVYIYIYIYIYIHTYVHMYLSRAIPFY